VLRGGKIATISKEHVAKLPTVLQGLMEINGVLELVVNTLGKMPQVVRLAF